MRKLILTLASFAAVGLALPVLDNGSAEARVYRNGRVVPNVVVAPNVVVVPTPYRVRQPDRVRARARATTVIIR